MMRACFHSDQNFGTRTQKSLSRAASLGRHAFVSVLRAAGEEPGSQAVVCDECGGDAGLRLRIADWRRPFEGAIAFRLWTATLYPVEIAVGQSFGEPRHISAD